MLTATCGKHVLFPFPAKLILLPRTEGHPRFVANKHFLRFCDQKIRYEIPELKPFGLREPFWNLNQCWYS